MTDEFRPGPGRRETPDGPIGGEPDDATVDPNATDFEVPDATIDAGGTDFEALVVEALEGLPAEFASRLGQVVVRVVDEPDPEYLRSRGRPGTLLGLFEGVPATAYGADWMSLPSTITIYRGPLERIYGSPESLRDAVHEVVRHEVGHHFGLSDARLDELERERWQAIAADDRDRRSGRTERPE